MKTRQNVCLCIAALLCSGAMQFARLTQLDGSLAVASLGDLYDDVVAAVTNSSSSIGIRNISNFAVSTNDTAIVTQPEPTSSAEPSQKWWRGRRDTSRLPHPHLGAIHPDDKSYGWIIDPTVERLRPVQYNVHSPHVCPNTLYGIEGEGGNKVLTKVRGGLDISRQWLSQQQQSSNRTDRAKILCMIYTVSMGHDNLAAIADTWGRNCDGFFGASNLTDHSIGAIDLSHDGPELYGNMWQKIRSMWTYAYDHYRDEYDHFFIAGDDVYMTVDNFRVYLEGPEVQRLKEGYLDSISNHYWYRQRAEKTAKLRPRPLMFSTPMMWKQVPVIAGGAGYALNQAALKVWGEKGADHYQNETFDSKEDWFFGMFLAEQGIYMSNTRDEKGSYRFGPAANRAYYFNGVTSPIRPKRLNKLFGLELVKGIDTASEQQISSHLKDDKAHVESQNKTIADLMVRYHAILYHLCDGNPTA